MDPRSVELFGRYVFYMEMLMDVRGMPGLSEDGFEALSRLLMDVLFNRGGLQNDDLCDEVCAFLSRGVVPPAAFPPAYVPSCVTVPAGCGSGNVGVGYYDDGNSGALFEFPVVPVVQRGANFRGANGAETSANDGTIIDLTIGADGTDVDEGIIDLTNEEE